MRNPFSNGKKKSRISQQDLENCRRKLEQEANEWLQKKLLNQEREFEMKESSLIQKFENKIREIEN
jgi:hypothetical protein